MDGPPKLAQRACILQYYYERRDSTNELFHRVMRKAIGVYQEKMTTNKLAHYDPENVWISSERKKYCAYIFRNQT